MIDRGRTASLDSWGYRGAGGGRAARGVALGASLLACVWLASCSPRSAPRAEEESLTSGRISVVCAPEARRLIAREQSAFQALYPQAHIEVRTGSSREAVRALFAAECDLAVTTRDLNAEERTAAFRGRLGLEGYRFARDAVVAVVHPANPVENLSVDELARIYLGTLTDWDALGGHLGRIVPVCQPMDADLTETFVERVLDGSPIRARVLTEAGDSAVVARVAATPGAIGLVTLAWADRGARAVAIAPLAGLPYVHPDPEAVYDNRYALTRLFNLYVRADVRPLANGFITYVTSRDGQALVHEAGLVPTSVPVRFVRRSPLMGSH